MATPLSLTLLYSERIAGDLALLPPLHTFLQQLKAEARRPALLLDLGQSCAADQWHCRETGGRSTLIALDGMGYHAANVAGTLDAGTRDNLAEQVTMGLVDAGRDWLYRLPPASDRSIRVTLGARDAMARLQIVLTAADRTYVEGNALRLRTVHAGQVGEAVVDLRGAPALIGARVHEMPRNTPPNPSIAGTVELVEAEARLLAKKRKPPSVPP